MRRTKIVATLGPAVDAPGRLEAMLAAGVDVVRLNFSHGTYEQHAERLARVRRAAAAAGRHIAVLQDLQGPKLRTGRHADGKPLELAAGDRFVLTTRDVPGAPGIVSTTYAPLPDDVAPGDRILLRDGLIDLRVVRVEGRDVVCEVAAGGELPERQGLHLPTSRTSVPAVTEKDAADLEFGLSQHVDYVALSFVRTAEDVKDVAARIRAGGRFVPVVAKLEKPQALDHLSEILIHADAVMVARGDLGVELPLERVPMVQKHIIAEAGRFGVPVITATQMLESMIGSARPTRAEASDVANAILDGSDAVMLSGETAAGRYPVQAVETMARVIEATESAARDLPGRFIDRRAGRAMGIREGATTPEAVAAAVAAIVRVMPIRAVWVASTSGASARLTAQLRPDVPIYAFTPSPDTARRLSLVWGVVPILIPPATTVVELESVAAVALRARGDMTEGDLVVLTGGHPFDKASGTNFLKIGRVGAAST